MSNVVPFKREAEPPPVNLEVEQALLGALLGDTSGMLWPLVSALLKPEHFSEPIHSRIYEAVATLSASGKFGGFLALKSYFEDDATLDHIGGMTYLARLIANAATQISLKPNAQLLRDLAARRVAIGAAAELATEATTFNVDESFRPALAAHVETMQRLFDDSSERRTTFSVGEASGAMVERISRIRNGEVDRDAIKTGLAGLDSITGGLHRGEYVVLGGRPSMGKTALAVQLAYNIAQLGGGVFYASLEMPVALLTPRLSSCRLWTPGAEVIDYQRILRGNVNDNEMRWIEDAAKEMKLWPLIIDDAPGLSAPELEARAQVAKSKLERNGRSLDLVVVDHIHKMRHPSSQSKVTEYTEISARLAEMAKRLDCPVLALAQLNRGVESRDDKRPQLSDLRESGSIEQDADTVLFAYRPSYYLERERAKDANADVNRLRDLSHCSHELEIILAKQRSGPIGSVNLWANLAANVIRDPSEVAA